MAADTDPAWMLMDVRWDAGPHGCDDCGTPHKRTYLIEEDATGRRMHVGKICARKYGIRT